MRIRRVCWHHRRASNRPISRGKTRQSRPTFWAFFGRFLTEKFLDKGTVVYVRRGNCDGNDNFVYFSCQWDLICDPWACFNEFAESSSNFTNAAASRLLVLCEMLERNVFCIIISKFEAVLGLKTCPSHGIQGWEKAAGEVCASGNLFSAQDCFHELASQGERPFVGRVQRYRRDLKGQGDWLETNSRPTAVRVRD